MSFVCRFFQLPLAIYLLFAAPVGSLIFALTMQFGFDVQPCILCLWQRGPFILGAVFALIGLFWHRALKVLLSLIGAGYLVNTGLAIFHTGVERHWWMGTSGCAIRPLDGSTVEDLRTQLLHMAIARCDQISWSLFGLSMANYNVPFSLGLAALAFGTLFYSRKAP